MRLGSLLKISERDYRNIIIKGISFDSNKVKKQDVFFAITGHKTSGKKFIKEAILKGASVIVSDNKYKISNSKIPILKVNDIRKTLSEACSNFYKKKPQFIAAVTGTNGKSSVSDFFYQILTLCNISAASIGTLGVKSKKYSQKTNLTSLDPLTLHKNLEILSKNKVNSVILEASSHGLSQKRLDGLDINIGIFTNLSHDHLDYHKSIKSYFNSKMYLFKNLLNKYSKIITDEEIKEYKSINKIANERKIRKETIGSDTGTIRVLGHKYHKSEQKIKILIDSKVFEIKIPLIGYFQVKNLLMAILVAKNFGLNKKKIFKIVNKIKPVPGRLECVANLNNNSKIIIDFAHTPDALEQSLIAIKNQFKKKIIIVFGCGGERDKKKRLIMGKIAKRYCRKIFVTDDNPRNENPKKIRNSIMQGCKKLAVNIGNRRKAIKSAIKNLQSNEVLLVAGKGHENKQDYGNRIMNFSDKKVIKEILLRNKNYYENTFEKIKYNGVSINSKNIKKNNIFFAIKGKKNDGHFYAKEAIKKGAVKIVVSRKIKGLPINKILKVKNTFSSLNSLAKATRDGSSARILGITGSVGKTTLKNLISFCLKNYGKVHHSPYSYNNKYGVPLSISNLKSNVDFGVFEIGMDKKGEIDNLSKIVKPDTAIITNISEAHLKNFKNLKDIARAKSEIISNILESGNIILNKDCKFFNFLSAKAKKRKIKVVTFGIKKKSDVFLLSIKRIKNYYRLKVKVRNKIFYFNSKYATNNFKYNILACICLLSIFDLNLYNMEKIFFDFKIPEGRGDIQVIKTFNKKFKFIDESYNANPLSMRSAIRNVSQFDTKNKEKKYALLGDMLELGKKSKKLHKELSKTINKSDIDKVFVYGKLIKETFSCLLKNKKGKSFKNLREAYDHFDKIIHNNDLLMVKGSNATGLNQFSKKIKRGRISAI